jgi:hypothetical protein
MKGQSRRGNPRAFVAKALEENVIDLKGHKHSSSVLIAIRAAKNCAKAGTISFDSAALACELFCYDDFHITISAFPGRSLIASPWRSSKRRKFDQCRAGAISRRI